MIYTELTPEQIAVLRPEKVQKDYEMFLLSTSMIGHKVVKRSKKKFKSDSTVNTVRGVIRNPNSLCWAVTFEEDDSCVDTKMVKLQETTND